MVILVPHVLGPRVPRRITFYTNINVFQIRIVIPHEDNLRGFGRFGMIGLTRFVGAANVINSRQSGIKFRVRIDDVVELLFLLF
jgi:hypothetical protein